MQGIHLRKYGVEAKIPFVLYGIDGIDLRVDAADGGSDCSIMKDEGAEATCTNDFVDEGKGYSITLSSTEMQAARIVVYVVDSATKVWLDDGIIIETYGHASAQHAFDLDIASVAQSADNEARLAIIEADTNELQTDDIPGALGTHDGKLDTLDTVADGIQTDLSNATDGLGALKALIDTIDGIVDDILTDTGTTLENRQVTIATDAARLTAVRAAVLTDLIDGGRLDLLIDAIKVMTDAQRCVSGTVVVNNPGTDTIFDLTAVIGTLSGNNDAYNNMQLTIYDVSGGTSETRKLSDWDGGNTRGTVDSALSFPVEDGVDIFILWNKYSPTAAAGGGATAQEVHEYDVSGITTPGQAGYEIQQGGDPLGR